MGTCKIQYNGSIISELEETGDVVIKYNDIPIRTLSGSTTGASTEILSCNGKYMAGNLTIGSKTLFCQGKMMSSDIEVTLDNPQDIFYLFDSTRSDNFLWGEYHYKENVGTVNSTAETAWPPFEDEDGLNTDSGKIVLRSKYGSMLAPTGASPAYLRLEANNSGYFANNVVFSDSNGTYQPGTVGLPFGSYILHVNAYCTKSGYATITCDSRTSQRITVNSTSKKEYSVTISLKSNSYIDFDSVEGCGDFIITDIWLEEV